MLFLSITLSQYSISQFVTIDQDKGQRDSDHTLLYIPVVIFVTSLISSPIWSCITNQSTGKSQQFVVIYEVIQGYNLLNIYSLIQYRKFMVSNVLHNIKQGIYNSVVLGGGARLHDIWIYIYKCTH